MPSKSSINDLASAGSTPVQYARGFSKHWVIVNGFDEAGNLKISDPWGISPPDGNIGSGTSYSLSINDFEQLWNGISVRRN